MGRAAQVNNISNDQSTSPDNGGIIAGPGLGLTRLICNGRAMLAELPTLGLTLKGALQLLMNHYG